MKIAGRREFVRIEDDAGQIIAYVGGKSREESERRAQLFVSAPKLLAVACEAVDLIARINARYSIEPGSELDSTIKKLHAAVGEARL